MSRYVNTQRFRHPELGVVHIIARANARRFTARWHESELKISIPLGCSADEVMKAIEQMKPRLLKLRRNELSYWPGWTYTTPECTIRIQAGTVKGKVVWGFSSGGFLDIYLPMDYDEAITVYNRLIADCMNDYARKVADRLLLPLGKEMARELGLHPAGWSIGYGTQRRGSCSASGNIRLSRNLVFFPVELRRYVIAHELAHLTHFNHSQQFYKLLNEYLGGRHDELKAASNAYKLPFA